MRSQIPCFNPTSTQILPTTSPARPLLLSVLMTMLPLAAPAGCFLVRPSDRFQGLSKRARLNPTSTSPFPSLIFFPLGSQSPASLLTVIPNSQLYPLLVSDLLVHTVHKRDPTAAPNRPVTLFSSLISINCQAGRVGCGLFALFACPPLRTSNTSLTPTSLAYLLYISRAQPTYKLPCPARPSACAGDCSTLQVTEGWLRLEPRHWK